MPRVPTPITMQASHNHLLARPLAVLLLVVCFIPNSLTRCTESRRLVLEELTVVTSPLHSLNVRGPTRALAQPDRLQHLLKRRPQRFEVLLWGDTNHVLQAAVVAHDCDQP